MLKVNPDYGYEYSIFISRDTVNDYIFDVFGCEDPVEISEITFDEQADGFAVTIDVSARDLARLEMAGAEIEA